MKFLVEKRIKLFLFFAAAILVAAVVLFYYNIQKAKSTSDLVEHTQEVISKSNSVLLDVLNIENGIRGYIISENDIFLSSYNRALKTINTNLSDLADLCKGNVNQQIRVDSLKKAVEIRLAYIKKANEAMETDSYNELGKIESIEQGKALTDKIRIIIAAINTEEFALLKVTKIENEKSSDYSQLILLMLLIFIFVIFALVFIILQSQRQRNIELEKHTASQQLLSSYSLSLIEASLDPLVTINTDGKITDMNEALTNITGYSREELTDTDFFTYFTEPQKAREVYQEVFAKGSVADKPLTIRHMNGKLTDVSFNGSVYKDAGGNVLGVVIVARDIAAQKWAMELQNVNKELAFQNEEKEKRAAELVVANTELAFQNEVKEKRAAELIIANKELAFQNDEKEKRAQELIIANSELVFQNDEKEKRAAELAIVDKELVFQTGEKKKQETANKELEALSYSLKLASQYSLSLIEASRDPLFTISPEGKITDMNEATVRVTGLTRERLLGTDFLDYFSDDAKAREAYQHIFAKGFVVDFPLTIKDGKLTDVLCNGSVYKDDKGRVVGVVLVARDITEQKRNEKELTEAIMFAELATGFAEDAKVKAEDAAKIAVNAVKSKQQFLSNMSHEIRTPMNSIIGFTKILLKTDFSPKQKEYLTAIKSSGDALIVLINDILDLAKVDAGKMTFEQIPFKLTVSISTMVHLFETKAREKNLELIKEYDPQIPEVLVGDPVRLHQIILNLLSNAVKFTHKGKITISLRLVEEDENQVSIGFAVSDTGIGIAANKIDKIFENFQQATTGTTRLYGGTGLGLAIVKQLVEKQGGTVSVKSKLDEGSTFSFVLSFPKTMADTKLEIPIMEKDPQIKGIKVLVVEDIPLNQLLMKTLLDDFSFECDMANDGKIAIEKMKTNTYDIVLMDLQMPEMNGFEATEYIREVLHSEIPIIALTADVTTVDLEKCKFVGMNDYIAKPVDETILYSKIVGLLTKSAIKTDNKMEAVVENKKMRYTNLDYLTRRTKANPALMMEMISLYIEQTPPLVKAMKTGFSDKDFTMLRAAVHKMIPSFSIMGISEDYENMAKQIQEYANDPVQLDGIADMVLQLETACLQACEELTEEFNTIKNTKL